MTRYQEMIVRYLEAQYYMSADKAIRYLHVRNSCSEIARMLNCSRSTLMAICRELGIEPFDTRVTTKRHTAFPNATDFLKSFENIQDAIVECRDPDRLSLSVEDTAQKLGVGRATVCRHTPDYLKYTFSFSQKRPKRKGIPPSPDHPWRKRVLKGEER